MSLRQKRLVGFTLAAIAILSIAGSAWATDYTSIFQGPYGGPYEGAYEDAANWSTAAVPNGGTTLIGSSIFTPAAATLSSDLSALSPVYLFLGDAPNASGSLTLNDSAYLNCFGMQLAGTSGDATTSGSLTINSGTLVNTGNCWVGYSGAAVYTQSGGSFATAAIRAGGTRTGVGTVAISGGTLAMTAGLYLGTADTNVDKTSVGTATMTQTDGVVQSAAGMIGHYGTGTYNLSGGMATFSGQFILGRYSGSSGAVNQTGGVMTLGSTTFSNFIGGTGPGTYHISNAASVLSVAGSLLLAADGGNGTFIQDDGVVQQGTAGSTYSLYVGYWGQGSYTINGGSLSTGNLYVGEGGTASSFTQNGGSVSVAGVGCISDKADGAYQISAGTLSFANAVRVAVGASNVTGHIIQTGGTVLASTSVANQFSIGQMGTGIYDMSDGAASFAKLYLGTAPTATGTFNQSGGVVSAYATDNLFYVGIGGAGTYNLSAGTLNAPNLCIGWNFGGTVFGNGTIHQTGGTLNAQNTMYLSDADGLNAPTTASTGSGTYILDAGTLTATSIIAGYSNALGTFNQNGGSGAITGVTTEGVFTPGAISGLGVYNLAGGVLNLQGQNNISVATFNFTGGTLQNVGAVSTNASLGASPVFQQDAGTTGAVTGALSDVSGVAGTLTKTGGGTLVLSGANTYSGKTTVQSGSLQMAVSAYNNVLAHTADIQGGQMVFDYTNGTTPAKDIRASLHSGAMYTSTGAAAGYVVGYNDDGVSAVTAKVALSGDTDMGGIVNN
ncbi:MAG: autotransporter-associated beta strand repeat-containing protein, partial [Thermoguttaceae bacterium]